MKLGTRPPRPGAGQRRGLAAVLAAGLVAVGLLASPAAAATAYHVDCQSGNDANSGTSPTAAWRTIGRANQVTYQPGDQLLLKRGCSWSGPGFAARGNGTAAAPIVVADYATGTLPQIVGVGAHEPAVLLQNVQNWTLRNLDLTQSGQAPQGIDDAGKDTDPRSDETMRAVVHILGLGPAGVVNCGEACTVRNIRLEGLKVHDGTWNGIYAGAGFYQLDTARYGYVDNVVVQGVEAWNNHKAGVDFTSTYTKEITYHTTNVKVLGSHLHDNGADGVVMGPVDHGLMDGNQCSFNGRLRDARLGCWSWDSHDVVIQFSESHHNMTPANDKGARDGGGYDCDLGSEDCLIQYSWSHDNQGEGFLLMQWPIGYGFTKRGTTHNIQMRYNVGERDGKKLAGGIYIFGGPDPVVINNNTIYYEPNRADISDMVCSEGAAICYDTWGKSGAPRGFVYNNIFITNGTANPGVPATNAWTDGTGTWTFDNNLWFRVGGGARYVVGNTTLTSFADWQARGFDPNGQNADPRVVGPLGGGPGAYQLQAGSPAINRGRAVTVGLRGMGTRDYFGNPIPRGTAFDVGAHEAG